MSSSLEKVKRLHKQKHGGFGGNSDDLKIIPNLALIGIMDE